MRLERPCGSQDHSMGQATPWSHGKRGLAQRPKRQGEVAASLNKYSMRFEYCVALLVSSS